MIALAGGADAVGSAILLATSAILWAVARRAQIRQSNRNHEG